MFTSVGLPKFGLIVRAPVKISVDGGTAVPLTDAVNFVGGSWSEDGSIIFGSAQNLGLLRIPSEGGAPETLAPLRDR